MDSDDIRKRRIERLQALQSQNSANSASSNSQNNGTPPSSANGSSSTTQLAPSGPASSSALEPESKKPRPTEQPVAKPSVPEPTTKSATPPPASTKPLPTLATVFQLNDTTPLEKADDADLESLIWEKLLDTPHSVLDYLSQCFISSGKLAGAGCQAAGARVKQSVSSYAILSATSDSEEPIADDLNRFIFHSPHFSPGFLKSVFDAASEDDEESVQQLISKLRLHFPVYDGKNTAEIMLFFDRLGACLDTPQVAQEVLKFDKSASEQDYFLKSTFLGTMFNSLDLPSLVINRETAKVVCTSDCNTLQLYVESWAPTVDLVKSRFLDIVNKLIRQSAITRTLVLDWMKKVLNLNHGQMAMNRENLQLAGLPFMLNIYDVLLSLSGPFVKLHYPDLLSQLRKINTNYFANAGALDISEDTKVLAAQNAEYNTQNLEESLNFVTECFFLTCGYQQFALNATYQYIDGTLGRQYDHVAESIESVTNMPSMRELPQQFQSIALGNFYNRLAIVPASYISLKFLLNNKERMLSTMEFAQFALAFDVFTAQGSPPQSSKIEISAPWTQPPPEWYANYPEFLIEAPLNVASQIMRTQQYISSPELQNHNEMLLDASIFFMSSPLMLRNPYLRSKFVELVFFGSSDVRFVNGSSRPGPLSVHFLGSETCLKYLLPALMSVFIDIEHTGRASQFYEKFNIRELVGNVMIILWRNVHYQNQLVTGSQENPEFFVKFVALLLSDATYLLDEALSKLAEVHKLEHEIAGTPSGTNLPTGDRTPPPLAGGVSEAGSNQDGNPNGNGNNEGDGEGSDEESEDNLEAKLAKARKSAKSFLQLSSSTVVLLNTFTKTVPKVFATPEIVDRFAVMLNYNLAALIGDRCGELRVQNASSLNFNPRQLLTDVVKVYLNLADEPSFPKALAKDERSYRKENFDKTCSILTKRNLLAPTDIDRLRILAQKTADALEEAMAEDEEFGDDVPDEYLDPLMYTIMENPVTLPVSKMNIDLSTIKTHLLSDPTDPFNRVPLKLEDVIPNDALREEIQEYKKKVKESKNKIK